jgi:hypothetical protein
MNELTKCYTDHIEVKESLVHGKGIFASKKIPVERLITVIKGEVINGFECERREEEENNVYIFWNGDECYIDTNKTSTIKYINHDCDPNCYVDDGDETSLNLVSLREICAGEELTIDYGYDEIYETCNCNTCKERVFN